LHFQSRSTSELVGAIIAGVVDKVGVTFVWEVLAKVTAAKVVDDQEKMNIFQGGVLFCCSHTGKGNIFQQISNNGLSFAVAVIAYCSSVTRFQEQMDEWAVNPIA